ncbi:lipid A export permease/ATP-binding protein MsbA [Halorhodospira halophila]|uniref:Lipid A ABC exporter, fused ATPase and inner membrane subunits MsbA n=1 Tax=Halorhodospira halophila (strain DSM 244 / SL1) TaxID=349124 RepID=A1WV71_HALHL|nr:lipid A export permease/ATP-binding protein MsbA [Halorhodospira halophila]ABM61583.1 lipid A ABC exporter, fused ATPase and inner membrane subunits MsbA [Halorhodospira halophila SL1]MBK1729959.1 lipid A export permease/ATP-binding protein MsbA [Halorhodospira halophila]
MSTAAEADPSRTSPAGKGAKKKKAEPTPSWWAFRRLFVHYALPHWPAGLLAIAAMLVFAGTQLGVIATIKPLLDDGLVERDVATIRSFAWLLLGLLAVQGVAYFLSHYWVTWISRQVVKRLRLDVHDRLLNMPRHVYDHISSGQMISRLTYEAEQTAKTTTNAVLTIFKDAVTVILIFGYMIYLSPWLVLIVGAVLPVIAGIMAYINKRFRKISSRVHQAVGGVGNVAEDTVHAHQEIKLFGQAEQAQQRFEKVAERNRRQFMKFSLTKYASVPLIRLVVGIALAVTISIATVDAVVETLTVGTLASFVGALTLLSKPTKNLVKLNAQMQKGLTAASSIFTTVDAPEEIDTGTRALQRAAGRVELRNVHFSYDGEHPVLRGIDLTAEPGAMIALTGPSGSGKSTLISLLPRFYDATEGTILLDGVPVEEYPLADLRRQFAPVSQDIMLFNTTVAENIAYGAQGEVSRAEIERAAEIAYARDFIEALPNGFDTEVGEDGTLLSGGQRQRIAIARAVLKDAPILLLDEATASLDTESERYIHAAFERLMQGRTAFVIAHRLSTVENADQILFLEDGQVVERGTHKELLAQNGRYAGLYQMQFEGTDA